MKSFLRFLVLIGIIGAALPASVLADPVISGAINITTQATHPSGATITFTPTAIDDIDGTDPVTCVPVSGSTFAIGTTMVTCESSNSLFATTTVTFDVTVLPEDTATITLRDNGTIVGPFTVTLAGSSAAPVELSSTGATTTYAISARSVLAELTELDAAHTEFDITDLQYFTSFNSFLINCIYVPTASAVPDCFNWTYAVNGSFPFVGMDTYTLQNGDTADIFFGSQWQVSIDKAAVVTDESFVVTAEVYSPSSGLYGPAIGETIGAVQFDSNFIATEFATSTVDANGQATLSLPNEGTYYIGIASSGYFPNSPVMVTTPPPPPPASGGGGGGGGGGGISHTQLNVSTALAYLTGQQHSDGSFDSSFLSDWAALAFAAIDSGEAKTKLHEYLISTTPVLSSVTDYERHTLALEALGINPYSGTAIDYIAHIVSSFDGTQIGDSHLDNDDIFALFPLLHAGYSVSDSFIQKIVAFILSVQNENGSWDGSVDMTAAAIQALVLVQSLPNVPTAIEKAKGYLHIGQQVNGGFGNSFSTSWALQAIAALNEPTSSWAPYAYMPQDYLASLQQSDGGVESASSSVQTRVWATAYAIPASLNRTWDSLLQSFAKPSPDGGGHGATPTASSNVATSTLSAATSTPAVESVSTSAPPAVLTSVASTTTATTSVAHQTKPKIKAVQKTFTLSPLPIPVENQTAAVANAPKIHFFSSLWNFVTSFIQAIL